MPASAGALRSGNPTRPRAAFGGSLGRGRELERNVKIIYDIPRCLSRGNAHSNVPVSPFWPPSSSRYLCTHASRAAVPRALRDTRNFYYEVNRGECGRNSRFGYAPNVVLRKQRGNGNRAARMREEISWRIILQLVDLYHFNFLSNDEIFY